MKHQKPRLSAAAIFAVCASTAVVHAQSAPVPTSADELPPVQASTATPSSTAVPSPDSTVNLETFTINVDRDQGYIAVDALAGGRTNTPVKLTPASMSSLTRAFIDDTGVQDVREALKWTANVVPADPAAGKGFGGQAFQAWSYNFRGAGAGQQGGPGPTRNYFSFYQDADAYNVDRIEFTRGPNSILFGLGTVGGSLSIYTKVPRTDKTITTTTLTVDDNGSIRGELDHNLAVNSKFALRLNALYDDKEGWRKGDDTSKRAVTLAALYKLGENTTFRVEGEYAKIKQTLFSSNIADKFSGWDGVTASETWGAAPTGGSARTLQIQSTVGWGGPHYVYIPGSKSLASWNGGYASTNALVDSGQNLNLQPYAGWYPDQFKLDWETTYSSGSSVALRPSQDWTYGHGLSNIEYKNLTAFIDHRFNRYIDAQIGFYRYEDDNSARDYEGTTGAVTDINRQLPDGSANPNFGKTFADFFLSRQVQARDVTEIRAQVNFKYDGQLFNHGFTQLLGISASQRDTGISTEQQLAQIDRPLANPNDWAQNLVWGRLYLDNPNQVMAIPDQVSGQTVRYAHNPVGYWFDFEDDFKLTSFAAFSNTRLFDDSLSLALGVRKDSYDENLVEFRRGPNGTDRFTDESDEGTTFTAGGVYYYKWFGVFANFSQNILPPNAGSQPYINGGRPSPEEGQGYDYGIRISTGDGKYYAVLSRYDTESVGRNVENPVAIRGIWQKYNLARGEPQDSGLGSLAYSDTTSLNASGYEFEVTANPTPNLRIQASYGLPDTEVVDFYPMSRSHFAANLAEWNAQIGRTTDTTLAGDLRTAINTAQNTLNQAIAGNSQTGSVDYTASLFANYTFTDTALKGWSFGAGAAFTGKAYLASYSGEAYYGNSFETYSAVIAYEHDFGKVRARFALNVDNILDNDDPIVTSYHWGYADPSGRHIRDGYYYLSPRLFRLSARFTF